MYDTKPETPDPIKLAAIMAKEDASMHECCLAAQCIRDLYDDKRRLTAENERLRERANDLITFIDQENEMNVSFYVKSAQQLADLRAALHPNPVTPERA